MQTVQLIGETLFNKISEKYGFGEEYMVKIIRGLGHSMKIRNIMTDEKKMSIALKRDRSTTTFILYSRPNPWYDTEKNEVNMLSKKHTENIIAIGSVAGGTIEKTTTYINKVAICFNYEITLDFDPSYAISEITKELSLLVKENDLPNGGKITLNQLPILSLFK